MLFNRCTRDNDDLSHPQKHKKNYRHSASLQTYCDVEHADIYKIVPDKTVQKIYPGIEIREPSLHNIQSNENDDLHLVSSKQSKPFWSVLWSNLSSKFKSNKKTQKLSSLRQSNPPPKPRRFNKPIPPPHPRRIKEPIDKLEQVIPPPPPRDAIPSLKPHNLPSLNKALLSDIHKGKKLQSTGNALEMNNKNIGPAIRRDPQISNVRKSLLRQIEQGKVLRKSSLRLTNSYGTRASIGMKQTLMSQLESRRHYFDEDQDVQSNLSGRSSSVWMD